MNLITGLTDQPNQQTTIVLSGGTKVVLTMKYRTLQTGWFYDINWNGADVVLGQRMVAAPNLLRQYINTLPFGLALITGGNVEPLAIEDFADGTASLYLLEGSDLTTIESEVYGAPPVPVQPTVATPSGTAAIIPPSSWGPASGDLGGTYPNPIVRAVHEGGGQQLALDLVADGQFLQRVGNLIKGTSGGTGDVHGPASAGTGNVAVFADGTGKTLADGGTLGTAAFHPATDFDAAGSASAAQSAAIAASLQRASNLSDVANAGTARTNLGLGTAATHNVPAVGNAAATEVVLGNDSRLSGAAIASYIYNVVSYGATGNGSTDDTTSINSAITAAAATGGVVFFPAGKYKISSGLSVTIALGKNVAFIGQSAANTFLYQVTASANGLTVDCSNGVTCYTEVAGLSFIVAAGVACGTALTVTYGNTNIASTSQYPGPSVHDISVGQNTPSDLGGWVNGITLINCWLATIRNIFGYGNGTTWASASSPGAGDGGPGSGWFIGCFSGVNFSISGLHGHFFGQGIRLAPVSASTAGQTQIAQGVLMSDINFVEMWEGAHLYSNAAHDLYDLVTLSNFQIDNGNVNVATHRCIYIEYGNNIFFNNGLALQDNGNAIIEFANCSGVWMDNVRMQPSTVNPSAALAVSGTGNGGTVDNCNFNNLTVTVAAGNNGWTINKTAGSTCTNGGTNNEFGDTKEFPVVLTPTATATYSFSVNISSVGLASTPVSAWADVITSLPNDYQCRYDYNNAGNTAALAYFLLFRAGGGTLSTGAIRLCVQVPAQ